MLRMMLQGVVTHIEFVTGIKMESRDQHGNCTESSDQGMLRRGDQACSCRRLRLSKTHLVRLSARISSDQRPFLNAIKRSK